MQTKVFELHFTARKTCFVGLSSEWMSTFAREQLTILQLTAEDNASPLYVSWHGDVTTASSGQNILEINGLFAAKQGLRDGQEVFVTLCPVPQPCVRASVQPLSVDDWEIVEVHSSYVESHLLDQVRVVWPGQVLPVWVQKNICIFMTVDEVEPSSSCAILEPHTELHIAPKIRGGAHTRSTQGLSARKAPPEQNREKGPHMQTTAEMPLLENNMESGESNSIIRNSTNSPGNGLCQLNEETNISDKQDVPVSLFGRMLSFANSWWQGQESKCEQKEQPEIYQSEFLAPKWETTLRVQPFGEIIEKHRLRYHKIRKSNEHPSKNHMPSEKSPDKKLNISHQSSCVYISRETFQNCFSNECDNSTFEMDCSRRNFLAYLYKIPSPLEKDEEAKKQMNAQQASRRKPRGVNADKTAESSLLDTLETKKPSEKGVVVRVVILECGCTYRKESSSRKVIASLRFASSSAALVDHVIIPDLLRRQLSIGVTGHVRLRGLTCQQEVPVSSISLHPLFQPDKLTEDMVQAAFKMWLADIAGVLIPLVVTQGTLIKFFLKKDFFGEFLITIDLPTGTSHTHEQYFLLSPDVTGSLKINLSEQATVQNTPSLVLRLPNWSVAELDPPLAEIIPAQLGGVAENLKSIQAYINAALCVTPLAKSLHQSLPCVQTGGVVICGPPGSGKTMLSRAAALMMTQLPYLAHATVISCIPLRGKRAESIQQQLQKVFNESAWHAPAVVVLDDLDQLAAAVSGPEQEMSGEAVYHARLAQVLKNILLAQWKDGSRLVVIATCKSRNSLHPLLVSSRGHHLFPHTVEIKSPDQDSRHEILKAILYGKPNLDVSCVEQLDLGRVATETEGYVARDLNRVVDRAVHAYWMVNASTTGSKQQCRLQDSHFESAMYGFTPASLRGIDLHKPADTSWDDVGGLGEVKKTLIETLQWPAKYPELFRQCPLRLRSGILLYGAPGTGKTLLAGAVAKECGLNFISIKGPELLSKYIGASEQEVRNTFNRAQSAKPCVLFFDEFDSLAPRRGHDSTGVTDRVVNQLLTQLDGVEGLEGVYVLAATSRPDLIDPALLRPGRLDRSLHCSLPNQEDRLSILYALTRALPLADDVDLEHLSRVCVNYTGADFKALLYNAQLAAIHESTPFTSPPPPDLDRTTDSSDSSELKEPYEMVTVRSTTPPEGKPMQKHSPSIPLEEFTDNLHPKSLEQNMPSDDSSQTVPPEHQGSQNFLDNRNARFLDKVTEESRSQKLSEGSSSGHSFEDLTMNDHMSTESVCAIETSKAHNRQHQVAVVTEKARNNTPIVFIPKLEEGVVNVSQEEEIKLRSKIPTLEPDTSSAKQTSSKPVLSPPQIRMDHLVEALEQTSPSVSEKERMRYQYIYENFVSSRGGTFTELSSGARQKTTLA